jgi:ribosomal protein S18 acetylase RimI-like enzyme
MSVALRNPTLQDADAAAEVLNEHSRRLHGKDDVTTNELAEDWAAPELDFPDDVLLAETNGTAVGYANVMAHGDSAWLVGALFQPEHWFVVESGDHLAGIALCRMPETEPGLGWVDILGVVPACRRRGLAIALLRHVFGHFADLGLRQVALSVDAENPTGAVGPYERAGMHVARKYVRYELHPEGDTASGVSKG